MTYSSSESTLTTAGDYSSAWQHSGGAFNIKIAGTFTGTVEIQRAFAQGADEPREEDYQAVTNDLAGTAVEITTPWNGPVFDPEEGVWYRAYLSALSAGGPITVRFSA